jgi:hypothetical protein
MLMLFCLAGGSNVAVWRAADNALELAAGRRRVNGEALERVLDGFALAGSGFLLNNCTETREGRSPSQPEWTLERKRRSEPTESGPACSSRLRFSRRTAMAATPAQRHRALRLYRHSLKQLLSWFSHREHFKQALERTRDAFESNRYLVRSLSSPLFFPNGLLADCSASLPVP